jgi:hypothetical protein
MLELAVMVSLSVSARRGSGTASMVKKTVLVSAILPATTTSDRTYRGYMAGGRPLVYFQRC